MTDLDPKIELLEKLGFVQAPSWPGMYQYRPDPVFTISGMERSKQLTMDQMKALIRGRLENLRVSINRYIDDDLKKLEEL